MAAGLSARLLRIDREEVRCKRRAFRVTSDDVRDHLERIGDTFLQGYHAALHHDDQVGLADALNQVESVLRGFAYEGAAMALALLDCLLPWPGSRLTRFLATTAEPHCYMVHVGAGWALARLPWHKRWPPRRRDPLLRWLCVDGYGFHEGYFHWPQAIDQQCRPAHLSGNAARVFDQGVGRSLWFVDGADARRIARTIQAFAVDRQPDLWSGVGLACAYAGGVPEAQVAALRNASPLSCRDCLAQGAAFAAKARDRAGNPTPHTELACQILCGLSAAEAAQTTDAMLVGLPSDETSPAYLVWQQRIQASLASTRGRS